MTEMTHTPTDQIGAIDGAADVNTRRFSVVLDDTATVQLDELVVSRQMLPSGVEVAHYGIVTEQTGVIEGAELPSDTRHIALTRTMPGQTSRCVEVSVLRTDPELWVAPNPGASVAQARGSDREAALFLDQMDGGRLAIGFDQGQQPIYGDFSFMNGVQGGHVSISGISGVAAKTSYALFLLYMILETPQGRALLGPAATQTRALVFNVKGEDLMHLDRAHKNLNDERRAQWAALDVSDPQPFGSVDFFAPPQPGGEQGEQLVSSAQSRPDATVYGWTPERFIREGLLRFCLTESDDRGTQVGFVEQVVRAELARHAYPLDNESGAVVICDEPHSTSRTFERIVAGRPPAKPAGAGQVVRDFYDLLDVLDVRLDPDGPYNWTGNTQQGTVLAFLRRIMALAPRLGHLIRMGVQSVETNKAVTVVDIHGLHEAGQRFVVGALVSRVFDEKQATGREPLRYVMLDELNKYAPREGHGPLRELFVDIAERGRSLGVLLIGCQQAAGRVAEPVVRQPALKICGRLDATEASEYKFLTPELRERATRFLPGTMVCSQPRIPVPVPLRFPFPPYATNTGDAAMTDAEEAQGVAAFGAL
ncbi:MAG TPA: ATP-binding protein [Baekduia sp.]|uniref:ATP-binding protein n=1 Tax=Baekduia sp. TaxID=2600305 RepID=UPI002CA8E041|nr:ATP-binding protein [Baekduia sp.]HMJ37096.1 ATP-binding protein [Baekduia sp.]